MSIKKSKRILFLIGTALFLLVIIVSVIGIQREIKWKNTRKEMDLMEHQILQKIVITNNERLPIKLIEALYTSIMTEETEVKDQLIPAFEDLTKEFLQRINKQMNIALKSEDLKTQGYTSKSNIKKYGDEVDIAYYEFVIDEETYHYQYYMNGRVIKAIDRGIRRKNAVLVANENNEILNPVYSDWKNKYDAYLGKSVSMSEYYEFMKLWELGTLPGCKYITLDNIQNIYLYKWFINKGREK